jgi:membrane associated rhomboid family serine protease
MLTITLIIVAITCLVSFLSFSNEKLMGDLIFYPTAITNNNQWYRFITSGFIHADIQHLAFNMFTLYFFGKSWEFAYVEELGVSEKWYVIMYLGALIVSQIPSYLKNRNNYRYSSLGASGAVSAVVFSMILLMPWSTLYVFILPVMFPIKKLRIPVLYVFK